MRACVSENAKEKKERGRGGEGEGKERGRGNKVLCSPAGPHERVAAVRRGTNVIVELGVRLHVWSWVQLDRVESAEGR